MGAILSILKGSGGAEAKPIDLPIDFNGKRATVSLMIAPATAAETEYATIQSITQTFPEWIKLLESYSGCGEYIRQVSLCLPLTPGHLEPGKGQRRCCLGSYPPCCLKAKGYLRVCYTSWYGGAPL